MILRLARKTSEAQFFFSDFTGFPVSDQVFRFSDGWSWWPTHSNNFSWKELYDLICVQMFPLNCNLNFPYFPCFFLQKQGDDWSTLGAKLEGAYVQPSMVLAWVARGAASQTFAMQILEDLFPFSKVFCSICVFFWGSLEIRKTNTSHKSLFESLDWKSKRSNFSTSKYSMKVLAVQKFVKWLRWFKSIPLMVQESGLTSWGLVVYLIIYRILYTSQVVVWDFFHQQCLEGIPEHLYHRYQMTTKLVVVGIVSEFLGVLYTLNALCRLCWASEGLFFDSFFQLPKKWLSGKFLWDPIWKIPWKIPIPISSPICFFLGKIRSRSPQDSLFFLGDGWSTWSVFATAYVATLEPLGREVMIVIESDSTSLVSFAWMFPEIGVTPKASILIGTSIINHPFWGICIFGNAYIQICFVFPGKFWSVKTWESF